MTVLLLSLSGLGVALLSVTLHTTSAQRQDRENAHARYVAQAGLSLAMFELQNGNDGTLGSEAAPVAWDKSHYYVTQEDLTPEILRLTATGLDDRAAARQELVVRRLPNSQFAFGAFGKEFVHLNSNSHADSYNSDLGSYASQAVNFSGTSQYAGTNGNVGSNGDITLDQNAKVWGDTVPGPDHVSTVLGNALVQGTTVAAQEPYELPAISVPSIPSQGALTVSAATTIASGDHGYTSLVVNNNKTLTIVGPAKIVISNLILRSGAKISVDASAGDVEFWIIDNLIMNTGSMIAPTDLKPKHLHMNLLSDNVINPELDVQLDTVDFNSNSKFYGTLLAPSAAIVVQSNFELFGSLFARSIELRSNASFHFDEALLGGNGAGDTQFETISWRDVPYAR